MKTLETLKNILLSILIILIINMFFIRHSMILILNILTIGLICFVLYYFKSQIYTPMKELTRILEDATYAKDLDDASVFKSLPQSFTWQIVGAMKKYTDLVVKKTTAEIFNKQTELTALQSQINPHFLYNTLDTVRGQAILNDDVESADMIASLSSFFRYCISATGNSVRFRDELNNVQHYMKIQQFRFQNRFVLTLDIDEDNEQEIMNCYVPRLILQPLVENAIYHGLKDIIEGGEIIIEVMVADEDMIISVKDNGKGMPIRELKALNYKITEQDVEISKTFTPNQRHTGIALPNIHKRLQLIYGKKYGLTVYSSLGHGTEVEILLPLKTELEELE